ncbi:MAG: transketolase C-terminal domain-containing protein [Pseudomonadota bacterium]|nr:transketolase C-terminal domain-containing protein [Pseudomonadota bacterium]
MPLKKYSEAINSGLREAMKHDRDVICFALGATDPKAIFGTTKGLAEEFGNNRVFDMPTSENGMTGVAIGAAMNGIKSVMTHQRLDFFLLAMDQLVNGAAKLHYMFGGNVSVPLTIRLIIGRGWGQGPTHSQNLQSWFAHIPGLKVVMPTTPNDAKGLLIESIFDPNPVVFLEHRWLHNSVGEVNEGFYRKKLGKVNILREGQDITIISMSYLTLEALQAANYLAKRGVSTEIIDLCSINPIDWQSIFNSVEKTGRIIVCDTGSKTCSVAGEIIATVSMKFFNKLKSKPIRLAMPDIPEPTSYALTKGLYIRAINIAKACLQVFNISDHDIDHELPEPDPHDVPGDWFKGPF